MKTAILRRARELGFDDCRVTTASPPATAQRFEEWLADGRHGEMAYLARTSRKRADPRLVLEGAQTIITLAVAYADDGSPGTATPAKPGADGFRGVVARYARFADYQTSSAAK